MEHRPRLSLQLLLLQACLLGVSSLRFDLDPKDTKCFSEELNMKALVLASYHVLSHKNSPANISVRATSPFGNTLHLQDHVNEGSFSFTTSELGTHMVCFWVPDSSPGNVMSIEFDWKSGVAAKDWASIAKREKIEGIELELRKLEDAVQGIHDDMLYLRGREEQMRDVNENTNSRLAWFSIASLFICLAVAGLQLWHLKTFFEKKKLI